MTAVTMTMTMTMMMTKVVATSTGMTMAIWMKLSWDCRWWCWKLVARHRPRLGQRWQLQPVLLLVSSIPTLIPLRISDFLHFSRSMAFRILECSDIFTLEPEKGQLLCLCPAGQQNHPPITNMVDDEGTGCGKCDGGFDDNVYDKHKLLCFRWTRRAQSVRNFDCQVKSLLFKPPPRNPLPSKTSNPCSGEFASNLFHIEQSESPFPHSYLTHTPVRYMNTCLNKKGS